LVLPVWIVSAAELGTLRRQGAPPWPEVVAASTASTFKQVCGSVAGGMPSQVYPVDPDYLRRRLQPESTKGSAAVVWIQN
jgi:hypothetical protein